MPILVQQDQTAGSAGKLSASHTLLANGEILEQNEADKQIDFTEGGKKTWNSAKKRASRAVHVFNKVCFGNLPNLVR